MSWWCFQPSQPHAGNKLRSISYSVPHKSQETNKHTHDDSESMSWCSIHLLTLFRKKVRKPQNSSKSTKLVSTKIWNKTDEHQTQIFEEIVDQISSLLIFLKHIRLGHADILDFCVNYLYQIWNFINSTVTRTELCTEQSWLPGFKKKRNKH